MIYTTNDIILSNIIVFTTYYAKKVRLFFLRLVTLEFLIFVEAKKKRYLEKIALIN